MNFSENESGFLLMEFLIAAIAIFSGFYFFFWATYFASNYTLASFYLNNFALCELKTEPKDCWNSLKQHIGSLKFTAVNKLELKTVSNTPTVLLVYVYTLPMIGLTGGGRTITLTSSINRGDWQ